MPCYSRKPRKMGYFPLSSSSSKKFVASLRHQDNIIIASGFTRLNWTVTECRKFYDEHGFPPCYEKDGKIYGYSQVLSLLGLSEVQSKWTNIEPVDITKCYRDNKKIIEEDYVI